MIRMPGRSHHRIASPLKRKRRKSPPAGGLCARSGRRHRGAKRRPIRRPSEGGGIYQTSFRDLGYAPSVHQYQAAGKTVENIWTEIPERRRNSGIVVIGGHYDSAVGTPGANDNASGVAATLEIARLLKSRSFHRTVRFVAFVNEEPPFNWTRDMGSWVYAPPHAEAGGDRGRDDSLETIGYYSNDKGSQKYPFPMSFFYPNRGNSSGSLGISLQENS